MDILARAREQVLERVRDSANQRRWKSWNFLTIESPKPWHFAHEVRMRWCGPEVEVEGIVSLKTGAAPKTVTSVRSQGFSPHRCDLPGSTFRHS